MNTGRILVSLLKILTVVAAFLAGMNIGIQRGHVFSRSYIPNQMKNQYHTSRRADVTEKRYTVLYFNPSTFLVKNRKYAASCDFQNCEYNNCYLTFDKNYANRSDAVIFDGIFMPKDGVKFKRPPGQIWIFNAQESPMKYHMGHNWWYKNSEYVFNWTMTYNINNTDIFLPYGELQRQKKEVKTDFRSIALKKNGTVLMISSNCNTPSRRDDYVKKLRKFVDVEVLGKCGKKWDCGLHYRHDDHCFQIINNYKFYLAFENAMCHQYFSEKFFENYNYDSVIVVRGGSKGEAKSLFPSGTFISTEDFKSIKQLGEYLKNISVDEYVKLLERKSKYYSVSYREVYQRALCNLCEKMNFQEKYAKVITDMKSWAFGQNACLKTNEVYDIH